MTKSLVVNNFSISVDILWVYLILEVFKFPFNE